MNEFELISKYVERGGHRVKDICYFRQDLIIIGDAGYDIGAVQGYIPQHQFFFGHISINDIIEGVINLANENCHSIIFSTLLYGGLETADIRVCMGVALGMSLMGSGRYIGGKRLYGVGCNRISVNSMGFGAATYEMEVGFNGYIFTII